MVALLKVARALVVYEVPVYLIIVLEVLKYALAVEGATFKRPVIYVPVI